MKKDQAHFIYKDQEAIDAQVKLDVATHKDYIEEISNVKHTPLKLHGKDQSVYCIVDNFDFYKSNIGYLY